MGKDRGPAPCHPERPLYYKGLCRSCWQKRQITKHVEDAPQVATKVKEDGLLTIEDLAQEAADLGGMTFEKGLEVVRAILGSIIRRLRTTDEDVFIRNLGTWYTIQLNNQTAVDWQYTNMRKSIGPQKWAKFRPAPTIVEKIKEYDADSITDSGKDHL